MAITDWTPEECVGPMAALIKALVKRPIDSGAVIAALLAVREKAPDIDHPAWAQVFGAITGRLSGADTIIRSLEDVISKSREPLSAPKPGEVCPACGVRVAATV